jgi:hypothetical protein
MGTIVTEIAIDGKETGTATSAPSTQSENRRQR